MGKSNKFDYTNRPNSGPKLGHIIGAALQKEADKMKRDAEKQAHKARKQSAGSSSGCSDIPPPTTHIIDLIAPCKDLEDEGVCALLDGLEVSLRSGDSQTSLTLEDLDLSGNGISTTSLARLAPVIELAKNDLKTLNLAGNTIKVETDREAAEWEAFLRAFRGCSRLRRIDLSGNVKLGCRALEVLARVHSMEPALFPSSQVSDSSATSHKHGGNENVGKLPIFEIGEADSEEDESDDDESERYVLETRVGLRSIPYIALQRVGLDDAGALWLSYLVESHLFPDQLVNDWSTNQVDVNIKSQQGASRGVDWMDNPTLGKEGTQLLERTEVLRGQFVLEGGTVSTRMLANHTDSVIAVPDSNRRKSSESRGLKPGQQQNRKSSIRSARAADGGEYEVEGGELDSARKKLKRAIIAHEGPLGVEVWRSALQYVRGARLLFYIAPSSRKMASSPILFRRPSAILTPPVPPYHGLHRTASSGAQYLTVDTSLLATIATDSGPGSHATSPHSPTDTTGFTYRENALTDRTNTTAPGTPMVMPKTTHRKDAFSQGNDLHTVTDKLNVLIIRNQNPQRFVKYQEAKVASRRAEGHEFRSRAVPCHLSMDIVERIMQLLMSDRELRVLSDWQKRMAFEWGQSKESLAMERNWLRKDESAQILMLLDSIGCLAYRH